MKYVMFTHVKTGLKLPAFFSDHFTHSEIKVGEDWVPTSAGTFNILKFTTHGSSTSLKLTPAPDDAEICKLVLAGMESMIYLPQDCAANLARLKDTSKPGIASNTKGNTHEPLLRQTEPRGPRPEPKRRVRRTVPIGTGGN